MDVRFGGLFSFRENFMDKILKQIIEKNGDNPNILSCTLSSNHFIKAYTKDDTGERIIEGWASTPDIDSYGDIVEPEAFTDGMERFKKNPVMFLNHNGWGGWTEAKPPIGKWIDWDIVLNKGLYVKGVISKTADDIWTLVTEGMLKGLSIGFDIPEDGWKWDEESKVNRIIKLILYEISLVGMPANPNTLTGTAKTAFESVHVKYLNNDNKKSRIKINTGEENVMDEETKKLLEKLNNEVQNVKEALKNSRTEGEKEEVLDKAKDEKLHELQQQVQELMNAITKADIPPMYDPALAEKNGASFPRPSIKAIIDTPAANVYETGLKPEDTKHLQKANDELYCLLEGRKFLQKQQVPTTRLDAHIKHRHGVLVRTAQKMGLEPKADYYNPEEYATAGTYAKFMGLDIGNGGHSKAMDLTDQADWVPTGFSSDFIERIDASGQVVPLFTIFDMQRNPQERYGAGDDFTVYKQAESTTDSASKIPASDLGARKVTFTCAKGAARTLWSGELDEDSIVSAAQRVAKRMPASLAKAIEDCTINGDETSTHMDGATTNLAVTDRRRLWYGLRYDAITRLTSATYDTTETTYNTAAYEANDLVYIRKTMGKYGINPAELAWIISPAAWYKTMAISTFQDLTKVSNDAYWLKGYINALAMSPLIISEYVPDTAETTGKITDAAGGCTCLCLVNKTKYEYGRIRRITVKYDEDIETDQYKAVGSFRWDFQPLMATTENTSACGLALVV